MHLLTLSSGAPPTFLLGQWVRITGGYRSCRGLLCHVSGVTSRLTVRGDGLLYEYACLLPGGRLLMLSERLLRALPGERW